MIGDVLSLLRDQLDAFLRAAAPALDENPADARVQLPDGAKADPIGTRPPSARTACGRSAWHTIGPKVRLGT